MSKRLLPGVIAAVALATATAQAAPAMQPVKTIGAEPRLSAATTSHYYWVVRKDGTEDALWRSDGTAAGTFEVVAHARQGFAPGDCAFMRLQPIGAKLVYFLDVGAVRVTDGTVGSTALLTSAAILNFDASYSTGSLVYFHKSGELWRTDGTGAGSVKVVSTTPGLVQFLGRAGPLTFFAAPNFMTPTQLDVSRSDGTTVGTTLLVQFVKTSGEGVVAMGKPYVGGAGLHRVDQTPPVMLIAPTTFVAGLEAYAKGVAFTVGNNVWISDGTSAGTKQIPNALTNERPRAVGDRIVFGDLSGEGLWGVDGTNTTKLSAAQPASFAPAGQYSGPAPSFVVGANGKMYLTLVDAARGAELYETDGTPSGTSLVDDLDGASGSAPRWMAATSNAVYAVARQGAATALYTLSTPPPSTADAGPEGGLPNGTAPDGSAPTTDGRPSGADPPDGAAPPSTSSGCACFQGRLGETPETTPMWVVVTAASLSLALRRRHDRTRRRAS